MAQPRRAKTLNDGEDDNVCQSLAEGRLLPMVYDELRRMASIAMRKERVGHTLQPTALANEAWLRLRKTDANTWENKAHFFGAAGRAMRRILVDSARRKSAGKRNAPKNSPDLDPGGFMDNVKDDVVLMIHESLDDLERENPEAARIVILKFFAGMDSKEIARVTETSLRSVERRWTLAKARLYQIIQENQTSGDNQPS